MILVGHSYGGFVITNAAYNNPNVKGLVYIAAHAPNEGQSLGNFFDIKKFSKDLLIIDSGGFAYINPAMFTGAIAQDVNPVEAKPWPLCKNHLVHQYLLKNLGLLHGSSFQHGIKYLRMTTAFLLM